MDIDLLATYNIIFVQWRILLEHPDLFVKMFVVVYMRLSICLSVYLSIYLSICLSVYLSIYLSICLYVRPSVRPSVHPSIHPSIHLSLSLSLSLSVCVCVCARARRPVYFYYLGVGFTLSEQLIRLYAYTSQKYDFSMARSTFLSQLFPGPGISVKWTLDKFIESSY